MTVTGNDYIAYSTRHPNDVVDKFEDSVFDIWEEYEVVGHNKSTDELYSTTFIHDLKM